MAARAGGPAHVRRLAPFRWQRQVLPLRRTSFAVGWMDLRGHWLGLVELLAACAAGVLLVLMAILAPPPGGAWVRDGLLVPAVILLPLAMVAGTLRIRRSRRHIALLVGSVALVLLLAWAKWSSGDEALMVAAVAGGSGGVLAFATFRRGVPVLQRMVAGMVLLVAVQWLLFLAPIMLLPPLVVTALGILAAVCLALDAVRPIKVLALPADGPHDA